MLKKLIAISVLSCLIPSTAIAATLPSGWYNVQTQNSPLYRLSTEDNDVKIKLAGNSAGQKFLLTKLSDGNYRIGTGNSVGNEVIGTNKSVNKYTGSKDQKWVIKENNDSSYSIINANTNKYLTYDTKNKITEQSTNNSKYQKFYFTNFSDKFTVTFKDGFGETIDRQSIKKGEAAKPPANPTKSGYKFNGWDVSFDNIKENITVTAKWTKNTTNYTVTFKDGQGNTLKTQTVAKGKAATAPSNPTRTGYTFNGWDKTFSNITGNTTVTAKWRANVLTINYYAGNATGDANGKWTNTTNNLMQTTKYNYDGNDFATYGLPNTTGGTWKLTQTGYNPTTNFLVGSKTATKKINQDTKYATVQDLAKAAGVDLGAGDKTLNLYAEMTPKTVKVVFSKNDGTNTTYTETYTYAKASQKFGMNLTSNTGQFGTWDRTGYKLLGWSLDKNATNKQYNTNSGVADSWIDEKAPTVNIYAVWQKNEALADVKDGWYTITPTLNSAYAIDVNGAVNTNGANIQLWTKNGSDAQKFFIHKIDSENYNIMTGTPGYTSALDLDNSKVNGTIHQWTYSPGSKNQLWKIVKADNGYVFFNKATGNVLDIEGDDVLKDGKNIWDYQYLNGTDKGQTFNLTPISEPASVAGKKKIIFKGTNQTLNIQSGSALDKAKVIAYGNGEGNNSKFAFEKQSDGTYHIRALNSDRYLLEEGGKIVQSRGSSTAFRWTVVWNGDGTVSFKNLSSGKFLYATSTANSTQLSTTSANTDAKARFTIPSTDYTQVIANGTYLIKSGAGMYLTTEYNNWNNGTKIAGANSYVDTKKGMRLFRVTYLGNGDYRFETGGSIYKSSIDMPNNVDTVGTQPQQYRNNNVAAQKFHILGSGNGDYRISHEARNIQTTTNTDPCTMQEVSDNAAQKMTFTKSSGYLIQDTYKYYFREDGTTPKLAIDVSKWQGAINWDTIKNAGRVDFAIIRMLDHSSSSTTGVDAYALKNIEACERLGIPYGVYWYSMATTTSELQSELNRLWNALGSHKPTKGIWFDVEAVDVYKNAWGSSWQSNGTGKSKLTEFVNLAKNNIKSHGFEPGLYLNKAQITCIDPTSFGIKWWCPRYFTNSPDDTNLLDINSSTYKGVYMWQWADTYTMAGVNGSRVDLDCVFYDDAYVWNGSSLVKSDNVTNSVATYTVKFSDGSNILKTETVISGNSATAPSNPTKSGYTFAGWDKSFNNITSNITITAKWTAVNNNTKNGWIDENGWRYYKNGAKVTGWYKFTTADGETTEHYSYFDKDGKLTTGWFTADTGYENLRYADSSGWVYGPCGFKTNVATKPTVGVTTYSGTGNETLHGSYYFNSNGELVKVMYENYTHLNQRSYFATSSVNYGNGCGPVSSLMSANMMGKLTNYVGSTYKTAAQNTSARYTASESFREYMKNWQFITGNTNVGRTGGDNGVWNYQNTNTLKYLGVNAEYIEDDTMYSSDRLRGILTWGRVAVPFCNVKLDGSYAKHFMVVNGWRLNNGVVEYSVIDPYGKEKLNPNCAGQNDGWYTIDGMNSITYKGSGKTSASDSIRYVRNFTIVGTRMKFGY